MGAWGSGFFENDDAMDWAAALDAEVEEEILQEAFELVIAEEGLIDVYDGNIALAAAEIAAALQDGQENELPSEVENWIEDRGALDRDMMSLAVSATGKILAASELRDLWAETDEFEEWVEAVEQILIRLKDE